MYPYKVSNSTANNAYRQVRFKRQYGNRALTIANVGLQGNDNSIEATYRETKLIENENIAVILG